MGEGVEDEGVVEGDVLAGEQLHRLLRRHSAQPRRHRVDLSISPPESLDPSERRSSRVIQTDTASLIG